MPGATDLLEINAQSQLNLSQLNTDPCDTGKEINAQAFLQGNTVYYHIFLITCN